MDNDNVKAGTPVGAKNPPDMQADSRAQPWKQFVSVPGQAKVTTFGKDATIRMIENRVDGKNLGG